MSVREDQAIVAVLGAAVLALLSVAVSVPTFTYLKNRNDSSIARDTRRVAEALEAFKITKTKTDTVTKKPFSWESRSVVTETCGVPPEPLELRPIEAAAR